MKKIVKLLHTREYVNILIALELIKKRYKYFWLFNILSRLHNLNLYIWIGPTTGNLYIQYDGYSGSNLEEYVTIHEYIIK